jgi:hypothetical protein
MVITVWRILELEFFQSKPILTESAVNILQKNIGQIENVWSPKQEMISVYCLHMSEENWNTKQYRAGWNNGMASDL